MDDVCEKANLLKDFIKQPKYKNKKFSKSLKNLKKKTIKSKK